MYTSSTRTPAELAAADPLPDHISLQTVLEFTSDAIIVLDEAWRYTYVNHAAELLLRRKRTEMLGQSHWELYAELLGTPAEASLRDAARLRCPIKYEQYIPGLYAWHAVLAVPSETSLILFCRDISERVRALRDEAVRESVRSALENVPVAITLTRGPQHRIDLQNAFSRRLVGNRNVEGMTVENALPETRAQGFIAILDRVYAEGKPFSGKEMPLRFDPNGSGIPEERFFDLNYQPTFDTAGKVDGIVHIGVDVTERLEEQRMLRQLAAERDATLRQLSEGVIVADAAGRITFVNDAARRLHGVATLGIAVSDYADAYSLLTEDGQPHPADQLPLARAVLHDEHVTDARWRIARPDGTHILVQGSALPVYDDAQRKIAHVLTIRALSTCPDTTPPP